ncbi:MAG: ABC transporter permease [Candidatus Acidiferrales bacterium]
MSWLRFFRRNKWDAERARELDAYLEAEATENIARGMSAEDARDAARRKLGNLTQIREEIYHMNSINIFGTISQDIRYAFRTLRRNPGFTAVAVLTLALGIGANTAIFSMVNAVLLRPLPYPESGKLMMVWATDQSRGVTEDVNSYPNFEDWKAQSKSFDGMAAFTNRSVTFSAGDEAEILPAVQASPGLFDMLRVAPAMGRGFLPGEEESGASHVAILSDAMWRERFAARPDILNQTVRVNELEYTIVGVMPPGIKISTDKQEMIYIPLVRDPNRGHGFLYVMGRLAPHISISQAQAEMDVITSRLESQYPKFDKGVGANVMPLAKAMAGDARLGLMVFLGVVTLVLLIACANVANLMLARSVSRQKELAVRVALGAGRRRIVQQILTESVIISLAGGALGLVVAAAMSKAMVVMLSRTFPISRITATSMDVWVLGFTLAVSLVVGIVFGLAPALTAASPELNENLREASRSATGSGRGRRIRNVLVIAETSLALVLLAGAGLLLKSLIVMRNNAPGFDTRNLLTVEFRLPRTKMENPADRLRFFQNIVARTEAVPGVRSAALVADLPLGGGSDSFAFQIPGRAAPQPANNFTASFNIVSADYFRTMAIPLLKGREFNANDSANTPSVIIINETAANRFWPGEDPIGKQITLPGAANSNLTVVLTVVGVARDVRQSSLGDAPQPEIFLHFMQPGPQWGWLVLVVRTTGDPSILTSSIKNAAALADREVPIAQISTMDDVLAHSLAQPGLFTMLLGIFAALALVLAAVGLYGVVSYTVTQRMHEMGIRVALGAGRGDIARLVLRQGVSLALAGTVIGMAGAIGVSRLLTHLVPCVQPNDPFTLAAVAVLLLGVALVASLLPARRAMRVDPIVALRYE